MARHHQLIQPYTGICWLYDWDGERSYMYCDPRRSDENCPKFEKVRRKKKEKQFWYGCRLLSLRSTHETSA